MKRSFPPAIFRCFAILVVFLFLVLPDRVGAQSGPSGYWASAVTQNRPLMVT